MFEDSETIYFSNKKKTIMRLKLEKETAVYLLNNKQTTFFNKNKQKILDRIT